MLGKQLTIDWTRRVSEGSFIDPVNCYQLVEVLHLLLVKVVQRVPDLDIVFGHVGKSDHKIMLSSVHSRNR